MSADPNSFWLWLLAVLTVGLLVAALMVLVQDKELPPHRGLIWALVIFMIPVLGPGAYLGWETLKHRQEMRD